MKYLKLIKVSLLSFALILLVMSQLFNIRPIFDSAKSPPEQPPKGPPKTYISGIKPYVKVETEKFELPPFPTVISTTSSTKNTVDSFDTSINLYRKKIILDTQANLIPLTNYVLSISLDTLTLIRESKVSFSCDQIYFTDEDGKTILSHWIEQGCGKENTKFWIRIPSIKPKTKKSIYIYYGNDTKYKYSNFNTTFLPEKNLLGWYYFDGLENRLVHDFSGLENSALLSDLDIGSNYGYALFGEPRPYIYFGGSTYLKYPINQLKIADSSFTIETFFRLNNGWEPETNIILNDARDQLQLGVLPDGKIFLRMGSKTNRIVWNTSVKNQSWYHLALVFDKPKKSINLYLFSKRIQPISGTAKIFWNSNIHPGDFEFGGSSINLKNGLLGYLDSLKIYNKALTQDELDDAYYRNQRFRRFPKFSSNKEEVVKIIMKNKQSVNFSSIKKLPMTDQVKINLVYASPMNHYYEDPDRNAKLRKKGIHPMIIERMNKENQPIFGFESHFYPFIGTEIQIKNPFRVRYVGIKMNNPGVISSFTIDFLRIIHDSESEYYEDRWTGLLDFLFPKAYACGPFYSYKNIGSSKLIYLTTINNVFWYRLEEPIYIDSTVTNLQLSYQTNQKVGNLNLEFSEMFVENKDNQLYRSSLFQKVPTEQAERERSNLEIFLTPSYRASFPLLEYGRIDFCKNRDNGLDITFANYGIDKIELNDETFEYMGNNLFTLIRIYNWKKELLVEISLENIKKLLMNQKIDSSHLIHFPILESVDLPKNYIYYITFCCDRESSYKEILNPNKIISWIFGKDPYKYFIKNFNGKNSLLYELWIANDGSFRFMEPKLD